MNNLENPIVNSDTILDYIPQREPMVLISRIYKCDERSIVTGFDITDSHILNQSNKLTESGIIENMAQTAASMAGFVAVKNGTKPVLGFIGNIKKQSS